MPLGARGVETAVVGLAGGAFRVGELELPGRASVWDGLPSAVYLPPGAWSRPSSPTGRSTVAVAQAPASGRETAGAPVRIGPEDVSVEIRGAGNATRQINHIITPEFPADRLEVVEVLTPSGNWSSGRRTSTTPMTCRARPSSRRSTTTDSAAGGLGHPAAVRRLGRGAVGGSRR